jgi:hypothetical protein
MHLSQEKALDLLELKIAESERLSLYAHIDSCKECASEFQAWSALVNLVRRAHLLSPPEATLASAKSIGETGLTAWGLRPLLKQVVALIVFDSSGETATAGARAGLLTEQQAVSRQVLLRTDDFDVHIRISKVEDHRELVGQILPRRGGGFIRDALVHLQHEDQRIGSARSNTLGEFVFTDLPDGVLSLQIDLPHVTVISALHTMS